MILRRLTENLRKQNWTAIAIEFVIVVLGVFVATQVADWSAREADKRRGHAYVQRLIADAEFDLANRRRDLAYFDAVNEGALQANALMRQASPNSRALVIAAYRATEYSYNPATRATWDEIVSSGDVGLLPTEAVTSLATYHSIDLALDTRESFRSSPYRLRVRRLISYEVQDAIRRGCSDARDAAGHFTGFGTDCRLEGVSDAEIAASAQALRRDPQVIEDLRYQLSELSTARGNFGGDVAALNDTLAALRRAE
jgi:hypothetical protein